MGARGPAPTPTKISTNSLPAIEMKGTPDSVAMALARSVLPQPGGPQRIIEWTRPDLLRVFSSGGNVVYLEENTPEDAKYAKDAADYLQWMFFSDNPGFELLDDFAFDGLTINIDDPVAVQLQIDDITFFEVDDLVGDTRQSHGIAGKEVF